MTDCNTLRDELRAYLDGELPAARRVAIRMHLARCAECREERVAMEQMSNDLRAGDAGELTADLRNRILQGASTELPESESFSTKRQWLLKHAMEIWAASSIVVVLGVLLFPVFARSRESARSYSAKMLAKNHLADSPNFNHDYDESSRAKQAPASAGPQSSTDDETVAGRRITSPYENAASSSGTTPSRDAAGFLDDHSKFTGVRSDNAPGFITSKYNSSRASVPNHQIAGIPQATLPAIQRHVVKTADITVEVEKLEEKSDTVEKMVRDSGGFVANNQLSTADEGTKSASLSLRVPVDRFDAVLASVAKLGEVKAKNVTGEDITEKVSDDSQSVRVLHEELKAVDNRLSGKTGFARQQDEEIRRQLRERIAQTEGRLESMKKLAALAAMTVQLREKSRTAIKGGGFIDEMGDTGRSAVNSFLLAARIPILALIWILAYAPVWAPLAIGYRYASRAHRQRVSVKEAREWQSRRSRVPGADATA